MEFYSKGQDSLRQYDILLTALCPQIPTGFLPSTCLPCRQSTLSSGSLLILGSLQSALTLDLC